MGACRSEPAGGTAVRRAGGAVEAALALGEHAEIELAVRAALEESPFRERLWGQLMLALYRGGRQADALETFQEARRALSEELGLEPGPELRRLQQAISRRTPRSPPFRCLPGVAAISIAGHVLRRT